MFRRRMTTLNMSSQMVHRFGFIRLGLMPNRRKGSESGPRIGTGTRIWHQHPLQIIGCGATIGLSLRKGRRTAPLGPVRYGAARPELGVGDGNGADPDRPGVAAW